MFLIFGNYNQTMEIVIDGILIDGVVHFKVSKFLKNLQLSHPNASKVRSVNYVAGPLINNKESVRLFPSKI